MVASMTAFGRTGCELVDWEIRSVNHRYLELGFRLPESFRDLEPKLRALTSQRIRRGKVDATLRVAGEAAVAFRLNERALRNVLKAVAEIGKQVQVENLDALDLMRMPGLLDHDQADLQRFKETALERYAAALDALVAHRRDEGGSLETLLRERLATVARIGARVRTLTAAQGAALCERLDKRMRELLARFDATARIEPERLAQEVALLAQKSDVTEELDRLDIHVVEARASLDGEEPCGRRLDFLMQELNREANTLAAKSALPEVARLAVDLKVAIEQMREQVQNVE